MDEIISRGIRRLVWLNIVIQTIFPLVVAFTPAIAGAGEQRFLQPSIHNTQVSQTEDALDISKTVAKQASDEDKQALTMAGYASQAGSFLASRPDSDAAASLARSMATGAAGDEIQQWFSRFGTARVQLDVDKRFSLKNSQFDLLLPLYDEDDNLLFTQGSLHRTDDRTQSNLGLGLRHFTPTWVLGANVFGDYDLSRDHARLGIGMEYWRNYIKFGANGYIGLTGWKDSPNLTSYEERAAHGWDLRAHAWLPWLPQLGGKLTYEKYYGQQVALFGVDNRQKNPHAIGAGIYYTPVPLVTLGAERRMEHNGTSDTRFSLGINYQWGVPLKRQLDPSTVAAMRSLEGSRHDLVERNNNIVLAYRKKTVIRLRTADEVAGGPGEQKSLNVLVTSLYGLSHIDWDAASFTASGGKIVQRDGDWLVELPAYQSGDAGVNTYSISGVAVGKKGNLSGRHWTQVTVLEQSLPDVPIVISKAVQENSTIATDKAGYQSGEDLTLTATLKDAQGNAVTGEASALTSTAVTVANATAKTDSNWTDNANGTYTRTYTATTTGTDLKASLKLDGWNEAKTSEAYTITQGGEAQATSAIATDKATYIAGEDIQVTVTLKDAQGNRVTGQASALTAVTVANATAKTGSNWTDNANGTYTRTYTATTTGTGLKASLKLDGWNAAKTSPAYAITQGAAVQAASTIATDKTAYMAGADIQVTVTLKDAQGNGVTGQTSALTAVTVANATAKTGSNWTDSANGTYTRTYTATNAGTDLKAAVKLDGWNEAKTSEAYAITQGAAAQSTSTIATDKATYIAGTNIQVTVTLKDAQGNRVTGQASALTAVTVANANSTYTRTYATAKTSSNWTDNANGTYTRTYTAIATGTGLKASLKLDGWNAAKTSPAYAITQGAAVQAASTIATDKTAYMAGADIQVTVTLKDAQGNGVTGQTSALTAVTVANATAKTGSNWTDSVNGTYTRTYTATNAGTDLKAAVKLDGWNEAKTSEAYAITQGAAAQSTSTIATDKATYIAGTNIQVTVTLKDAQGNRVTGQASALTAVTVANATVKTRSNWTDNANGTYTRTYMAIATGTGLKAAVKLDGWNAAKTSEAYTITQGAAAQSTSTIATDKAAYIAGADIQVTVTLKDMQGNGVTGQTSALTAVTVANATAKTDSWKENASGTYTRTYTATTTGTGLKAAVKLDGWNEAKTSEAYTITQGPAAQSTSTIATDKATYIVGADIQVTVTLKDAQGNKVFSGLTADAVTVPNAVLKAAWKDHGDGTYSATYGATKVGSGLKASLKLADWRQASKSVAYSIFLVAPNLTFTHAEQHIVWTRSYVSQAVDGMPEDVEQQWSVSDASVATIDNTGHLTLLKAGETKVTVHTPGNTQYRPATASYLLKVSKADPQLKVDEKINTAWGDKGIYRTGATFNNSDVLNSDMMESLIYTSKNTAVATVSSDGIVTGVKPGTTVITVSSPETSRFLAASADVVWVMDKGTLDISFAKTVVDINNEEAFVFQKPMELMELPIEALMAVRWESSNADAANTSTRKWGIGEARLTLIIPENDYYKGVSGYYDVKVYAKPAIRLEDVSYTSKGVKGRSGTWTPVFTDDTLTVTWRNNATSKFNRASSVSVSIKDTEGNELANSELRGGELTLNPSARLWGKTVNVELVAKGYGTPETREVSSVTVKNLEPKQIWNSLTVKSIIWTYPTYTTGFDSSCQETWAGRDHTNMIEIYGQRLDLGSKTLISPMQITLGFEAYQNGNSVDTSSYVAVPATTTSQQIKKGYSIIANTCWRNHYGDVTIKARVDYNGQRYDYTSVSRRWYGNGVGINEAHYDNL